MLQLFDLLKLLLVSNGFDFKAVIFNICLVNKIIG